MSQKMETWRDETEVLIWARRSGSCEVLGPGRRAVIWVQGCPIHCPGCVVPDTWAFEGGHRTDVESMTTWVLAQPDIDGLTLSGGEPMAQAGALAELVTRVRAQRDLSVMSYTGYRFEWLRAHGSANQYRLLGLLDLLVDGPYVQDQHGPRRWRGSINQRIHRLSDRYRNKRMSDGGDYEVQCEVDEQGAIHFMGILPPNFRKDMTTALTHEGIQIRELDSRTRP